MAKLVVKRYATALFDLAVSLGALKEYEEEVKVMIRSLEETPDFMAVLNDHKVTKEDKSKLVQSIFEGKVQDPIVGLLDLMVKKGRQAEILEVLKAFLERVKAQSGITKVIVTSAITLNDEQKNTLIQKLEASTQSKVELETIVDASIIAGLVVRVGDKVVDASIKGEMQTLKKQLSEIRLA